jgi:hypothetical protein
VGGVYRGVEVRGEGGGAAGGGNEPPATRREMVPYGLEKVACPLLSFTHYWM